MFKRLFLPLGIVSAAALSFLYSPPGIYLKGLGIGHVLIVTIFFVCGCQTEIAEVRRRPDRKITFAFFAGAAVTLVAAPWLAVGIGRILGLTGLSLLGLVVIAAVPPTLSSGIVMTETAEGNVFFSMLLTIGYSVIGVLTMPLMFAWCLAGRTEIRMNPGNIFLELFLLVVLPFLLGFLGRKILKRKLPAGCAYIPSICVILLVLVFFSASADQVRASSMKFLIHAGAGGLMLHLILLAAMWYGGRAASIPLRDRKALALTGASKTMTIAFAGLSILDAGAGPAAASCLIYYFIQMVLDSAIAGRMVSAKREAELRT